jgi:hypothetical protein
MFIQEHELQLVLGFIVPITFNIIVIFKAKMSLGGPLEMSHLD